jgi:two-component system, chemotaxis family, chemotaxis protein CheY
MSAVAPAAVAPATAALRFLIVDDCANTRRIVRKLLAELGCSRIDEAGDGVAALAKLRSANPGAGFDFVLSDIHMPNLNGFDLLQAIHADPALCRLPVLMVTAEARQEDRALAAERGAAGYIVKPFTKAALDDKVQQVLRRRAEARR